MLRKRADWVSTELTEHVTILCRCVHTVIFRLVASEQIATDNTLRLKAVKSDLHAWTGSVADADSSLKQNLRWHSLP